MSSGQDRVAALGQAQRILVIGRSGGGKSTLSQRLASITGLPFVSLDKAYWLPGWKQPDRSSFHERVGELVAAERWIIDGTGGSTLSIRMPRAELVIWLRIGIARCLMNVMRRVVTGYGQVRPEMAEGCPEKFNLEFLRYIIEFDRMQTPRIEAALKEFGDDLPLIVLRSRSEIDDFVSAAGKLS